MSGWYLALVDLCGPSVAGVETCTGPYISEGIFSDVSGINYTWILWNSGIVNIKDL